MGWERFREVNTWNRQLLQGVMLRQWSQERERWDNNLFVLMERADAAGEGGHLLGDPSHRSEGLAPAGTGSDRHSSLATCGIRQVQRQGGGGRTRA